MKKSVLFVSALAMLASCADKDAYTVKMEMPENEVGNSAFIVDSRTGAKLDSVMIDKTDVVFKGKISEPTLAMVTIGGYPYAQFVLEPGDITMTGEGLATGTPANDAFSAYNDSIGAIVEELQNASEAQAQDIYVNRIVPASVDFIVANPESPFALPVFGQVAMYLDADQIETATAASKQLAEDPDVQRTLSMARAKAATSAGNKYVDFTVNYDDKDYKLSDYIVPGHWTIVDFWASWCGPCRREIPGIKALYDQYKSKGLNVVGVAVRDKPEDTLKAMEQDGVTWPVILNAGMDVLQTYGIMGIPCIMLVNPDGEIVARDLFGSQLNEAVEQAMK
ncbi:MAG: AhpC/TSA family protein [Muribaculaceae bacterium]|nr:AhpC/TSA family protein [Muribaculaceae bacterium]MDE6510193.1 AhpC/TSA family protein [Muribaculaceae bacterium]